MAGKSAEQRELEKMLESVRADIIFLKERRDRIERKIKIAGMALVRISDRLDEIHDRETL